MKKISITSILLACIALLGACNNDIEPNRDDATKQNDSPTTYINLKTELLLEEMEQSADEALRPLKFDLTDNDNGHAHPKPQLHKTSTLTARLLFLNTATKTKFWADQVVFKLNKQSNTYEINDLNLKNAPADIRTNNPESWKVLCIVGGDLKDGNIQFGPATTSQVVALGGQVDLPAVYISKTWTDLTYTWDEQKQAGSFSVKTGETIKLKNQCMTLLCRIKPNQLGKAVKLQGFRIYTNSLSFGGHFDINSLQTADQLPNYVPMHRSNGTNFWATAQETIEANTTSKFYAVIGIPTADVGSLRVSPIIGEDRNTTTETMYTDFEDKPTKKSYFAGLNNLVSAPKVLEHPIEGFFQKNPLSTDIHKVGSGHANEIEGLRQTAEDEGYFRRYAVPTVYQLAVLIPGMKGGVSKTPLAGNLGRAILDFRQGRYHDTRRTDIEGSDTKSPEKERIFVWGNGDSYTEFDAVYEHNASSGQDMATAPRGENTYYGIRFQGLENKYLSAYRFVRKGNNIEITVRTLGPSRAHLTIRDIKKKTFWEAPLDWNQREWKRTLTQGIYWSNTTQKRGLIIKKDVYHMMKIFPNAQQDPGGVAQPDGAYTTTATRPLFLDSPDPKNNQANHFILFSTDQTGHPLR